MNANPKGRQHFPAFSVYHFFWQAVDFFFPPSCPVCGRPGVRWCTDCQASVQEIGAACCPICGQPGRAGVVCPVCQAERPAYKALRSYGVFQGALRKAIHTLKYQKDVGIGEALAAHLIEVVRTQGWWIDLVTAVPLSQQRLRDRGYNQSGLLARPVAYWFEIPYRPAALRRTRNTKSQVGLTAVERRQNVQGAFASNPALVQGKTVLVIDDVTTTGSTLDACAVALLSAGAAGVYGLTLARALHPGADAAPADPA